MTLIKFSFVWNRYTCTSIWKKTRFDIFWSAISDIIMKRYNSCIPRASSYWYMIKMFYARALSLSLSLLFLLGVTCLKNGNQREIIFNRIVTVIYILFMVLWGTSIMWLNSDEINNKIWYNFINLFFQEIVT